MDNNREIFVPSSEKREANETKIRPRATAIKAMGTIVSVALVSLYLLLWLRSGYNWMAMLFLSLVSFVCEEWLGQQWLSSLFREDSRWSVSNSGVFGLENSDWRCDRVRLFRCGVRTFRTPTQVDFNYLP